ncbi:LptF/LptG family permease, partial [Rhizobium johnstonii]|uniref:LptF/LptG family permease n=1 Tax=Rhizobium johnstonii TaxID=3019933 RepID=UPI003F9C08DF
LAAVISVFSFFFDNVVEPRAKTVVRQMISETYADLLSSVIEEKTFRKLDEGLYVQISQRMAGRMLKGLFVVDGAFLRIIDQFIGRVALVGD